MIIGWWWLRSPGKGLPLGNQTSQWFALYYMDRLDRLIKEQLGIKYYTRYMDDFILIHENKDYLKECLKLLLKVAFEELGLNFNDKTQITPIANGVKYLGFHIYVSNTGKIIRKITVQTKKRYKRLLKKMSKDYSVGKIDFDYVKPRINSYNAHLKHGHTYRLRCKLSAMTGYCRKT